MTDHILQFFVYEHLPPRLRAVSKPFCELAKLLVGEGSGWLNDPEDPNHAGTFPLARNPERTVALRKLLEAKDAAVRAALAKDA